MANYHRFNQQSLNNLALVHPMLRFVCAEALRLCDDNFKFEVRTSLWPQTSSVIPYNVLKQHKLAHEGGYAVELFPRDYPPETEFTHFSYVTLAIRDAVAHANENVMAHYGDTQSEVVWGTQQGTQFDSQGNSASPMMDDINCPRRYVLMPTPLERMDLAFKAMTAAFFPAFTDDLDPPDNLRAILSEPSIAGAAIGETGGRFKGYATRRTDIQ